MRLVDKDKLLKELIEGHEAGLGLVENSKYGNINNVADAIDAVEYADEVDLSEHDKQIKADERRKFAEWLTKSDYANGYFDTGNGFVSVDKVLAEYEKENQNEQEIEFIPVMNVDAIPFGNTKETCAEIDDLEMF